MPRRANTIKFHHFLHTEELFISTAGDKRTSFDCAATTTRAFFAVLHARYVEELLANDMDQRGAVKARPDLLEHAYALGARLAQATAIRSGDPGC